MKKIYLENISVRTMHALEGWSIPALETVGHFASELLLADTGARLLFTFDDRGILHIVEADNQEGGETSEKSD